ncbi:hypothetical protein GCM10027079_02450 [Sediminivirga luteola]|uniref:Uncharacterized protein n=1 Tax=Sediminivirga luteola TaxID=1774748 RepID=A0A8J2XEY1_9MICO|nr:hypothetical protein GCM10011333_12190 [Sediminivirga luteola]
MSELLTFLGEVEPPCVCLIHPEAELPHGGHCCSFVPDAPGEPPAPVCHPVEWRAERARLTKEGRQ